MSASISTNKTQNSSLKLLKQIFGWPLKLLKNAAIIVLIIGLLIGGGALYYLRGRTIRYLKAQLSSTQNDLKTTQSDFDSYMNDGYGGTCTGDMGTSNGVCPDIKVLNSSRKNDSQLKSGQFFAVVEVELSNPNKNTASIDSTSIKLKDSKSYIYPQATVVDTSYDSSITYDSINNIQTLGDQGSITLASKEKVRGFLIFRVSSRDNQPFQITYFTSKSNTFNL